MTAKKQGVEFVRLGDQVQDVVTGLKGIATACCLYLNGCLQWEITPQRKADGDPIDGRWVDVEQVRVLKSNPLGLHPRKSLHGHPDWPEPADGSGSDHVAPIPIPRRERGGGPQSTPSGRSHP